MKLRGKGKPYAKIMQILFSPKSVLRGFLGVDTEATWSKFVHVADEIRGLLPESCKVSGLSLFLVTGRTVRVLWGNSRALIASFLQIASSADSKSSPPEDGWKFQVDGHQFRFGFSTSPDEPGYYICRDH